jgi:broad specificity phosphatase PhoE
MRRPTARVRVWPKSGLQRRWRRFVDPACRRIAISSHGNVIGLLLNSLDAAFHRPHTEQLRNPDLLRLLYANSELRWHKGFKLAGLELISTEHGATPVDRH